MNAYRVCYYLTVALPVPPLVAQAAYDAQQLCRHSRIRSFEPRGALGIRGAAVATDGTGYAPYRSQPGLITAGIRAWPVRLELLPRSEAQTRLGLRPLGSRRSGFPPDAVLAVGHAVLGRVADALIAWTDAPFRSALSGDRPTDVMAGAPGEARVCRSPAMWRRWDETERLSDPA